MRYTKTTFEALCGIEYQVGDDSQGGVINISATEESERDSTRLIQYDGEKRGHKLI